MQPLPKMSHMGDFDMDDMLNHLTTDWSPNRSPNQEVADSRREGLLRILHENLEAATTIRRAGKDGIPIEFPTKLSKWRKACDFYMDKVQYYINKLSPIEVLMHKEEIDFYNTDYLCECSGLNTVHMQILFVQMKHFPL